MVNNSYDQYIQSRWNTIQVATEDVIHPYLPVPRYAANAVELSLKADRANNDPLLTENSMDTWTATLFVLISHILGPKKWPAYKQAAVTLIQTCTGQNGRMQYYYDEMMLLVSTHGTVGYLHNDLARQLNDHGFDIFPILHGLRPAGGIYRTANEQANVLQGIARDWDREFYLNKSGVPCTRHKQNFTIPDRINAIMYVDRMRAEASRFLEDWDGTFPDGLGELLNAMENASI